MSTLKDKKILITGGAGFIGSHLAAEISRRGGKVTIVDKALKQDLKKFIHKGGLKRNFDFVFHLAGSASVGDSLKYPLQDLGHNLDNTLFLLESLRQLKRPPLLIFASSAAVYGIPKKMPVTENSPPLPVSHYGASKLAAEHYIRIYHELYDLPAVILRFFSVYGPGQKKQVIYDLMTKLKKSPNRLEVLGSAAQTLDLIYIDDLIQAMVLASQKAKVGETYNLASGQTSSITDIVRFLCRNFGIRPEVKYRHDNRPGTDLKWQVNINRIKKLGFKPKVPIDKGIKKVYEWFRTLS